MLLKNLLWLNEKLAKKTRMSANLLAFAPKMITDTLNLLLFIQNKLLLYHLLILPPIISYGIILL